MAQVERDGRYSVSLNVDTVKSIITKVNALITENHPFAVAAFRFLRNHLSPKALPLPRILGFYTNCSICQV